MGTPGEPFGRRMDGADGDERTWADLAILVGTACAGLLFAGVIYLLFMNDTGQGPVFQGLEGGQPGRVQDDDGGDPPVPVDQLVEGECVDVPKDAGRPVRHVVVVDCEGDHHAVVYAVTELTHREGQPWPGDETVRQWARQECADRWAEVRVTGGAEDRADGDGDGDGDVPDEVDIAEEPDLTATYPADDAWQDGGARWIVCLVAV